MKIGAILVADDAEHIEDRLNEELANIDICAFIDLKYHMPDKYEEGVHSALILYKYAEVYSE